MGWLQPQIGCEMLVAHFVRCFTIVDEALAQAVNQVQSQGMAHLDAGVEYMEPSCSIAKQGSVQAFQPLFADILGVQSRR